MVLDARILDYDVYHRHGGFWVMLWSTCVIFFSLGLITCELVGIEIKELITLHFFATLLVSFMANYQLIAKSDRFKTYFKDFNRPEKEKFAFAKFMLFHLGVLLFGILTVRYTIGFSF